MNKQPTPAENLPVADGPQVVMTYFLIGCRCASCRKIEALARETTEKDFSAELASGNLVFRLIDTGEAAQSHYLKNYQLSSKSVVLSRRADGRETEWTLFFASLIPLALASGWVFMPVLLCGLVRTALMAGLALFMIFSARAASRLADGIGRFQPWFLKTTGVLLLIAGLHLTAHDSLRRIA